MDPEEVQGGPARPPATSDAAPSPTPIVELLEAPDFPKNALGKLVDIGGYTGVVTDIVNQSLKVRSPDGGTKSFNANGLRRIYIRVVPPEPPPSLRTPSVSERSVGAPEPTSVLKAPPTVEPDFSKPVKDIAGLVSRPDYPQGLLGEHVRIGDYSGVIVQIVNRSFKVKSQAETTRSYNADALRKLHTQ